MKESSTKTEIDILIKKANAAQIAFEEFDQDQVDKVVKAIAKVVYEHAEKLARMAVDETRMGSYEDKVKKKLGKSKIIYNSLKGKKSTGIIEYNKETGIALVAKPMGVVGAVTPCTNPVVTPMCNAMFALKGKNAIIIAPHPRAKKCGKFTVDLFREALSKLGAPDDLIQIIEEPSIALTEELMSKVDVVVATGGMGMVKAAYSSGKPAYGVGVGNIQVILDREIDISEAVPKIVTGRAFDNGIICSAEQTVMIPNESFDDVIAEFEKNDCCYIKDQQDKEKLRKTLFIDGIPNKDVIGQDVQKIASLAGIQVKEHIKVLIVEADGIGSQDVFCKEKMCPVLTVIKYGDFKEAVEIVQKNLDFEGRGHSISIHSNNEQNIEYAANKVKVSRILINQICATMNGGSFFNGLAATTTLGCGSWGNNSISENLDFKHLINISRIAYCLEDAEVPTDEMLWADE